MVNSLGFCVFLRSFRCFFLCFFNFFCKSSICFSVSSLYQLKLFSYRRDIRPLRRNQELPHQIFLWVRRCLVFWLQIKFSPIFRGYFEYLFERHILGGGKYTDSSSELMRSCAKAGKRFPSSRDSTTTLFFPCPVTSKSPGFPEIDTIFVKSIISVFKFGRKNKLFNQFDDFFSLHYSSV